MARRKAPAEVPARALLQEVHEVLDAVGSGAAVDVAQLQVAAAAAAGLRRTWLQELSEAIGFLQPGTPEFQAFKDCTKSMLSLFVQFGLVSAAEMQHIWFAIEQRERR